MALKTHYWLQKKKNNAKWCFSISKVTLLNFFAEKPNGNWRFCFADFSIWRADEYWRALCSFLLETLAPNHDGSDPVLHWFHITKRNYWFHQQRMKVSYHQNHILNKRLQFETTEQTFTGWNKIWKAYGRYPDFRITSEFLTYLRKLLHSDRTPSTRARPPLKTGIVEGKFWGKNVIHKNSCLFGTVFDIYIVSIIMSLLSILQNSNIRPYSRQNIETIAAFFQSNAKQQKEINWWWRSFSFHA